MFVSFADASWANKKDFGSQCGHLCVGMESSLLDGGADPLSDFLAFTQMSQSCTFIQFQRKHSPATQAQEETEFTRLLWLEILQGGYDDTMIDEEISRVGNCFIINAKMVLDAIHRTNPPHSMQDKRSAVEGLALREAIGQRKTLLRWSQRGNCR